MPSSEAIDSYLICGTPRTGSTLLCGLLRSTGIAGQPESYFRQADESDYAERWRTPREPDGSFDYLEFVRAAVTAGSSDNGVFAARIMWGTMDRITTRLRDAYVDHSATDLELLRRSLGRTRFVNLCREDVVAQAVSWTRAEQTNYWQDADQAPVRSEPRFDFDAIHGFVRLIHEHESAWRTWFATLDIQPHLVLYEDLVADTSGITRSILEFFGLRLPNDLLITHGYRRQADEINLDWTQRYLSLRS